MRCCINLISQGTDNSSCCATSYMSLRRYIEHEKLLPVVCGLPLKPGRRFCSIKIFVGHFICTRNEREKKENILKCNFFSTSINLYFLPFFYFACCTNTDEWKFIGRITTFNRFFPFQHFIAVVYNLFKLARRYKLKKCFSEQ